nr:protein FAF-like, chloroplastic [Ipomoea batatas]GMD73635.1 protein FAF-like, chloroplastic [Ipomoea batatas]
MSAVIKNFNLEQVAVAVAAPPSPPPLPPAKKPKQGIGSILGSDSDHRAKTAASIRRTLSADMSSKKWLSQNGLKKIASSGEFADDHPHTFSGEEDELSRPGQDEVWRAIQAAQKPRNDGVKPSLRSCESWSSILTTKNTEDCSKLPPPYVHPLVKARTASSLSEKSLEICTESLGSETGSDGFSSHSPPESGDEEEEQEEEKQDHNLQIPNNSSHSFEAQAVKLSYSKRSAPRSFPPPLPSLAKNKASLQVLSRRQNGRLILEAVSVPPRDYLHAQRHDGRLLLTLVNGSASEETGDKDEAPTKVFDIFEETDDTVLIDDEKDDDEQELTKISNLPNMSAPQFMKQFKKNTLWFNNKAVDLMMEKEEDLIITPLPPPPPAGVAGLIPAAALPHAAAFVNTYDYFWRKKPTVASVIIDTEEQCKSGATNNLKNSNNNNNNNVVESPKVALLRGSVANNMLRGCKESRRSLLPWEPYCIATT